jgi:hypothetical protein
MAVYTVLFIPSEQLLLERLLVERLVRNRVPEARVALVIDIEKAQYTKPVAWGL